MARPGPPSKPSADLLDRFTAIVGAGNAVRDDRALAPYVTERRGSFPGATPLVVRPGRTADVAAILKLANETGTAIVPQGGNTGLVGGQVPDGSGVQIVVALDRLNRVRTVDPDGDTMIVEAGVTLATAKAAAREQDRLFPLSIASEETCQIGGNISSNAGGVAVLAYGNARELVLGLEVVLANGETLDMLRTLRKDNSGYDLKHLFIGAEGTLGIITAAALKLFPIPKGRASAMVGVASPEAALALFQVARGIGRFELTSCELIARIAIDFCLRHLDGAEEPLRQSFPWYVLLEISSGRSAEAARADIDAILAQAAAAGLVGEARIARSDEDGQRLWRLRYAISDVQRPEGASIKHDVAVPVSAVPAFIVAATAAVERIAPGCRPVPFGHLGDGNIHFNVSQPAIGGTEAFLAVREKITEAVHALVRDFRGSIAAEHGIGQMKRTLLPQVRSPAELGLMRTLKAALDPKGILNPGKVI